MNDRPTSRTDDDPGASDADPTNVARPGGADPVRALDALGAPTGTWDEARRRARSGGATGPDPVVVAGDAPARRPRVLAAAIVLAVVCVGALAVGSALREDASTPLASEAPGPALDDPAEMWGRVWVLDRLVVDGETLPIPAATTAAGSTSDGTDGAGGAAPTRPWLTTTSDGGTDGDAAGTVEVVACNRGGGAARVEGDRLVVGDEWAATTAACIDQTTSTTVPFDDAGTPDSAPVEDPSPDATVGVDPDDAGAATAPIPPPVGALDRVESELTTLVRSDPTIALAGTSLVLESGGRRAELSEHGRSPNATTPEDPTATTGPVDPADPTPSPDIDEPTDGEVTLDPDDEASCDVGLASSPPVDGEDVGSLPTAIAGPGGSEGYDVDAFVWTTSDPTATLIVETPLPPVIDFVGERTEEITLASGPALLWYRDVPDGGEVQVRVGDSLDEDPCGSFALTVRADSEEEARELALAFAERVVVVEPR